MYNAYTHIKNNNAIIIITIKKKNGSVSLLKHISIYRYPNEAETSGICLMNKAWNYKISSCIVPFLCERIHSVYTFSLFALFVGAQSESLLWAILLSALLTYNSHIFVFFSLTDCISLGCTNFRFYYCVVVVDISGRLVVVFSTLVACARASIGNIPVTFYKQQFLGEIFFQIYINQLRVFKCVLRASEAKWLWLWSFSYFVV